MDLYMVLKEFGFPVFVAAFLLFRLEPILREQNKLISDLKAAMLSVKGNGVIDELRASEIERQRRALLQQG